MVAGGLRVCVLCGYRPTPGGGGTEKHIFELATGLIRRGVCVDIICEDRSFLPDTSNPLSSHLIGIDPGSLREPNWLPRYLEKSRRFAEALDPERYDVVHCHSHYGYHTSLKLARLAKRPALITTFHLTPTGSLRRLEELGMPMPEGEYIDRAVAIMEETMAHLSDHCIAVSGGVAREVEELYHVPRSRVTRAYNWIDPNVFYPRDRAAARRALGLDPDATYLLYVGHFQHFRGRVVVESLRMLPEDVRLIAIDPEPAADVAAEFGDRVVFPGYQPPERMALYYSAADLQCFSTVYGAFGLVLVEGMACGCPAVVFDLPAMNEIVTPESGFLVSEPNVQAYAQALHEAIPLSASKREAAARQATCFAMDDQIERVLDIYDEVIAGRRHAAMHRELVPIGSGSLQGS